LQPGSADFLDHSSYEARDQAEPALERGHSCPMPLGFELQVLRGGLVFVPEGLLKIARRFNAGCGRIDCAHLVRVKTFDA
jgi:hypothetical protein